MIEYDIESIKKKAAGKVAHPKTSSIMVSWDGCSGSSEGGIWVAGLFLPIILPAGQLPTPSRRSSNSQTRSFWPILGVFAEVSWSCCGGLFPSLWASFSDGAEVKCLQHQHPSLCGAVDLVRGCVEQVSPQPGWVLKELTRGETGGETCWNGAVRRACRVQHRCGWLLFVVAQSDWRHLAGPLQMCWNNGCSGFAAWERSFHRHWPQGSINPDSRL